MTGETKVCRICKRELPLEDFHVNKQGKDGHRNVCKHCYVERNMKKRTGDPNHKTKHRTELSPEKKKELHAQYMREYRATHKDKVKKTVRESRARRRAGLPKRKPGPPIGSTFVKMVKPKQDRLCEKCANWPCFRGIESLESDFAREGCNGWKNREEENENNPC